MELCPDTRKAWDSVQGKDEFAAKERSRKTEPLLEKCGTRLIEANEAVLSGPPLILETPLTSVGTYDFERGAFPLSADVQAVYDTLRVGPGSCPRPQAVLEGFLGGDGVELIDEGGYPAKDVRFYLAVPESEDRELGKRLKTAGARLQIMFKPGVWKESGLFCSIGGNAIARSGEPIAFRADDDTGPIGTWSLLAP